MRKNAALYNLAPGRTGRPGRPRGKGSRLASLAELAPTMPWMAAEVTRYGSAAAVELAQMQCLWSTPFGTQVVQLVMVREVGRGGYGVALVSTDLQATPQEIVERYAARWSIEVAFEEAKQIIGVGEARNRTEKAVRRTVLQLRLPESALALVRHLSPQRCSGRRPWCRTQETPATLYCSRPNGC